MFESARAVADGRMSLYDYLDGLNHDNNTQDMTLEDLRHSLDEELPIPVAVTEGEEADRRQSAIIPPSGEAGQKRKWKEAVGDLVDQKPERKKPVSWTEDDHKIFLLGLRYFATLPKKWKSRKWEIISAYFLPNKNTSELASHAQKYFKRQQQKGEKKRKSINDTILQKEDEVRLKQLIRENLRARKRSQLSQRGEAPTVVQSHAGQFRQVPGASFPAEQKHEEHHLHQMPGIGVPAVPRLSFGACVQTHQMQPAPPVTWNMAPNTPNCTSSGGTPQIHQRTSHPAPASGLSCANTTPHTQSITQEFQPSPTAQPMVRPHLPHNTINLR
ncbi:hypothetical protein CDL15_Pgr020951 [Punica granatum]|uniref:Myb-like domain-containing protein n=1 Tax=Punica granatum TaxID=22663 RepID=A0A218Y1A0_PUNGR|nr:hypothetical protein CDL15_Pgr020951 [Punica granatum]